VQEVPDLDDVTILDPQVPNPHAFLERHCSPLSLTTPLVVYP
jgi:hypothetical protein